MSRRRRSYEAGHKPKLLVVIDDTEECDRAVYFASRRAARIGGNVVMLRVIEMHDQSQQWLGVADIMRAEAHEEADAQLSKYAARANGIAGITPERVVREGDKAEEILKLIDEDEDIFILVLAAGTGAGGTRPAGRHYRPHRGRLSDPGRYRARPPHRRGNRLAVVRRHSFRGRGQRRAGVAMQHLNFQWNSPRIKMDSKSRRGRNRPG